MISIMAVFSVWSLKITQLPMGTCFLAFAPGGVAEMASTSMALNAYPTFVDTVQSLRLITVLILAPSMLKVLNLQALIKTNQ